MSGKDKPGVGEDTEGEREGNERMGTDAVRSPGIGDEGGEPGPLQDEQVPSYVLCKAPCRVCGSVRAERDREQ